MTLGQLECKDNNAAYVKTIMPEKEFWEALDRWLVFGQHRIKH